MGEQKVTLGVWSRFAVASGTRNQAEVKKFLQWLLSDDSLLHSDSILPDHMIPPQKSVREEETNNPSSYSNTHADWLRAFNDWSVFTDHPAMNMGAVDRRKSGPSHISPPWAWEVFGRWGIVDTMQQDAANGNDPEQAWREVANKMQQVVETWKSMHPQRKLPGCK